MTKHSPFQFPKFRWATTSLPTAGRICPKRSGFTRITSSGTSRSYLCVTRAAGTPSGGASGRCGRGASPRGIEWRDILLAPVVTAAALAVAWAITWVCINVHAAIH